MRSQVLVWIVIYGHEDFHEYGLLFEVNALLGKGLGVLLFEDEAHFFGEIVAERGDHFAVALVHDRGTRGLVIDPSAVVDCATAEGDGLASDRLNLDLEEGRWVWETFRVGEAGHAVGTHGAAGDCGDHGSVAGVEIVFALVALVAIGRGGGPQDVGFVHVGPMDAANFEALVEVFDGAEPLRADVVGVLSADVARRLD